MEMSDLPSKLLETFNQHLPPGTAWVPLAAAGVTAGLGLLFLVKGARLAPVLAAFAFAAIGASVGPLVSKWFGTPLWPTIAASCAAGVLLGIVLFRLWFALLVSACLTGGAIALYGTQTLQVPLSEYLSKGFDTERQLVTLPQPADEVLKNTQWGAELAQLWAFLGQKVPAFQTSFFAILITTGLAGLIFALLLPRLARSFWAATVGTVLFLPAIYALAHAEWPAAADWLNKWGLIVAAFLWAASLACNLADMLGFRPIKSRAGTATVVAV